MFEMDRRIEILDENLNKTIKMLTLDTDAALEGLEETILEQQTSGDQVVREANNNYAGDTPWQ